jgi:hypothetical protein
MTPCNVAGGRKKRPDSWAALILIFVALLGPLAVTGEDYPRRSGKRLYVQSEPRLAGIDIYKDNSDRAVEKLGRPSQVTLLPATSIMPAYRVFEWKANSCSVRLVSLDWHRSIVSIDVWGDCPNSPMGVTGRGLRLGATIGRANRVYAPFGNALSTTGALFDDSAPTLQIDFDKTRKVNHLKLTNPCVPMCY